MSTPKRVESLSELIALSHARKSVVVPSMPGFIKRKPAAFVANMQGRQIHNMILCGMFVYKPKTEVRNEQEAYIKFLREEIKYWQSEIERKSRTHESACSERAFLDDCEQKLAMELDDYQDQIQQAGR